MLRQGAIKEVKKFLKLRIKKENSSNKVIGINEIKDFLSKKTNLNEVKEKITIKTRQYAKRQNTWARGQMMDWQKVNPKDLKKILKKI
jgi:tRNA delta(2)-isopentenylpyrophosphate transferase